MMPLQILSKRTGGFRNYLWIAGFILSFILLPTSVTAGEGGDSSICAPDYYGDITCCPTLEDMELCAAYPCLNYCVDCWYPNTTPPADCFSDCVATQCKDLTGGGYIVCEAFCVGYCQSPSPETCNGDIYCPAESVGFAGLWNIIGHVTIWNPEGTEIINTFFLGTRYFPACPSGPGKYTYRRNGFWPGCYICNESCPTPTPEPTPTQNQTPTPTPTHTPIPAPTTGNPADVPVADFTASVTDGTVPLTVHFTDTSTHRPLTWIWSFGDGGTSRLQNPTHTYNSIGNYTVSLMVSNRAGTDTERKTGYVTARPAPVVYKFSMTNIERYANPDLNMALSYPSGWTGEKIEPGTTSCSKVAKWLEGDGWTQKSYKKNQSVSAEDFGSQGDGLNEAVFHYHYGHGEYGKILLYGNSTYVQYTDVIGKWGNQNKWVMIDSCEVLPDEPTGKNWGKALGSSHGILGFASKAQFSYGSGSQFIDKFFEYSLKNNETIADAFKRATEETEPSWMMGAVVFKNQYQYDHDHFPGHGEIAPDDESIHDPIYYSWPCNSGTEDKIWWQMWG